MILRTDCVGRQTVPQPYSLWEESKLIGIHIAIGHKISVVMSSCTRCADRLKNSGCWYLNKMINYSVHQDYLAKPTLKCQINDRAAT